MFRRFSLYYYYYYYYCCCCCCCCCCWRRRRRRRRCCCYKEVSKILTTQKHVHLPSIKDDYKSVKLEFLSSLIYSVF